MQVRFLSDGSEYRSYGGGSLSQKKEGGGIFWWAILITLLMGAATFCWFFSIMVFSHPEKPFNYKVLAKFKKLTPLRPYTIYTAPNGKSFGPRDLLAEFYSYNYEQLSVRNDMLKRSYLKNYQHEQPLYLLGSFRVLNVRALTDSDVFTKGWIVRARASDLEDVDLELVLPGLTKDSPPFTTGDTFNLQKRNYASALHVQRMEEDRMCVTVVPLAYQAVSKAGADSLALTPPESLNMEAYWPITRDPGPEFAATKDETVEVASAKQ
ncbi:hypothetical protein SAMN02745166_02728 [Prosthecobacter debontii]|uniref:Uncharacterized protein n=1 Tax=Prosthecobacter debontii TaxID=48467 RepID=A0A1T4YAI0_9BACT|nr:hypothetical protein [Prosthecobacter debontii]SKA98321.1 hypothetical protein SAMN02745166_02728 [Prosthecobacter debontii]